MYLKETKTLDHGMLRHRSVTELLLALRFGLVGIMATATHIAMLWILLTNTLLPVLIANTIAFLSAFGISFMGNYLWTFGAPGSPKKALLRFLVMSISAFMLNSVILGAILRMGLANPLLVAIGSVIVIPAFTLLTSRLWVFNYSKSTPALPRHNNPCR